MDDCGGDAEREAPERLNPQRGAAGTGAPNTLERAAQVAPPAVWPRASGGGAGGVAAGEWRPQPATLVASEAGSAPGAPIPAPPADAKTLAEVSAATAELAAFARSGLPRAHSVSGAANRGAFAATPTKVEETVDVPLDVQVAAAVGAEMPPGPTRNGAASGASLEQGNALRSADRPAEASTVTVGLGERFASAPPAPGANGNLGEADAAPACAEPGVPTPAAGDAASPAVSALAPGRALSLPSSLAPLPPLAPAPFPRAFPPARSRPFPPPPYALLPARREGPRPWYRTALRLLLGGALGLGLVLLGLVMLYRFVDPPASTLMLGQRLGGTVIHQRWVPLERISPYLSHAVILSEDARFCRHNGVDWGGLAEAIESSHDGIARGGSTITMQVVKNLFLWPSRSYLRKAVEIPLAYGVELAWSKRRILEIYLNVAEWGPGIFGAEAASFYHFGKPAFLLTPREAALLAVALPNPLERQAGRPGPGMLRLANRLAARMRAAVAVGCLRSRR